METATISTRVDTRLAQKLDLLSKATERSRSFLIAEAVQAYVEEQAWQIEAIQEGIRQADNDEFASAQEVKAVFAKWGVVNKD